MNNGGRYYVEWDPVQGLWNVKDCENHEKVLASYISYKSAKDFIESLSDNKEDEESWEC